MAAARGQALPAVRLPRSRDKLDRVRRELSQCPSLTIRQQCQWKSPRDTTILDAAASGGVKIPTLCYLENVQAIGACRVCLVEVEGAKTLVASCVTPVDGRDEGLTPTRSGCARRGARWSSCCCPSTTATARPATGTTTANCRRWPRSWGSARSATRARRAQARSTIEHAGPRPRHAASASCAAAA